MMDQCMSVGVRSHLVLRKSRNGIPRAGILYNIANQRINDTMIASQKWNKSEDFMCSGARLSQKSVEPLAKSVY